MRACEMKRGSDITHSRRELIHLIQLGRELQSSVPNFSSK